MQAAAFILSTIVLLVYAAIASATLFFGHAISRGTFAAFFSAISAGLNWLIPWGLVGVACCVVVLLILGVNRSTRRVGALILFVLALASASVVAILIRPSDGFGIREVAFLLPCFAVVAVGVWLTSVSKLRRFDTMPNPSVEPSNCDKPQLAAHLERYEKGTDVASGPNKRAIDEWSIGSIKATFGVGGLGVLMLCVTSLDRLNLHFAWALFIAILPGVIFALASPDFFPIKVVRAAQWFAIGLYTVLSVMALYMALDHGFAPGDGLFIGFMFVGLVTCLVATIDLCGAEIPNPTGRMFSHTAQRIIREFFMVLGALSLAAVGILLLMTGGPDWLGWTCIIVFGLGAIVLSIEFVRGIKRTAHVNAARGSVRR